MTLTEFWPIYLDRHKRHSTKVLHAAGIIYWVGMTVLGILEKNPMTGFMAGVFGSYAMAFAAHLFIEHNHPASFEHPLLSIVCDFKMTFLVLTGEIS